MLLCGAAPPAGVKVFGLIITRFCVVFVWNANPLADCASAVFGDGF
jgi:hypothetical protein